jgi:hypothetical protein
VACFGVESPSTLKVIWEATESERVCSVSDGERKQGT